MVVTGAHDVVVPEGDLVLSRVALALGALDHHPGGVHLVADVTQQRLDPGAAEDGVVHVVAVGPGQALVAAVPRAGDRGPAEGELPPRAGEGGAGRGRGPA